MVNCGKLNIWGKLMEDKGYFRKVSLWRLTLVATFLIAIKRPKTLQRGINGRPSFSEFLFVVSYWKL